MHQQYGSVTYGTHPNTMALDLAFSIHTDVDASFYDMEYPDHDWYKVVEDDQILSNINPGATSYGSSSLSSSSLYLVMIFLFSSSSAFLTLISSSSSLHRLTAFPISSEE